MCFGIFARKKEPQVGFGPVRTALVEDQGATYQHQVREVMVNGKPTGNFVHDTGSYSQQVRGRIVEVK